MEHQDEYVPLSILLADHWDKPLSKLPKTLQAKGGFFTMLWDRLNREQRHELVSQIDYREDPKNAGERHVGWHDMSMDARVWGYLQDVSPKEAAMVMCRLNPFEREDPERIYVDGDETSPHRYRLLLRTFEDVASTIPKHRTLMEWRTIAQQKNLRYHSWIDDYADAIEARALMEVSAGKKTTPIPTNNWKLKIQAEAARLWEELVKQGCSPTRNSIKGNLAKWCRDNKVKTDGDIFPNEDYIYRHVIRAAIWKPPTD